MMKKKMMPAVYLSKDDAADVLLYTQSADMVFLADDRSEFSGREDALIKALGSLSEQTDIPVAVYQPYARFEDIKKIIYAGAAYVVMDPFEGGGSTTLGEGIARFGDDVVWGSLTAANTALLAADFAALVQQTNCRVWLMTDTQLKQYADVIRTFGLQVLLCRESLAEDAAQIKNLTADFLMYPLEICGLTWNDCQNPADLNTLRAFMISQGMTEDKAKSSLSFEQFKLNSDGLIPVITQDYKTGEVLMMAYMNKEAFEETLKSGRMTYYSRSRQCLWKKGDTSGHYQFVKSLDIDCDCDTILAKVRQIGAACHTGNRSCFFTNLVKKEYDAVNPATILDEIMTTVLDRKENPKEGSYTNYLFDKGIDKILKKVGEEATEIVIAAKNPDVSELKYEISDFLYHMIVLMAQKGVTWEEVSKELTKRH